MPYSKFFSRDLGWEREIGDHNPNRDLRGLKRLLIVRRPGRAWSPHLRVMRSGRALRRFVRFLSESWV